MTALLTSVALAFILTTFATRDTETESLELDTELEGHGHKHGQHNQHHHRAAHHKAVEKTDVEAGCGLDSKETDTKVVMKQIQTCLKARQALMKKTHISLEEQKKQGKIYNDKLQKIFGVLNKLKGQGLRESWEADHNDILKQFLGEADTIQQAAGNLGPDEEDTPTSSDEAKTPATSASSDEANKSKEGHVSESVHCSGCLVQGCLKVPDYPNASETKCNGKGGTWNPANCTDGCWQPGLCNTGASQQWCQDKGMQWLGSSLAQAADTTGGSGLLEKDQKSGLVSQLLNVFSWR